MTITPYVSDLARLAEPFPERDLNWRPGSISGKGDKCTLLAFLDARMVMDRLDHVVGPENWQDTYAAGPGGGVVCRIGIRVGDGWVWKEDGAENSDIEAIKGGLSDAFKRAAVKWGIGRYLYGLDTGWHTIKEGWGNDKGIDVSGKRDGKQAHLGWVDYPKLPAWALPKGAAPAPREATGGKGAAGDKGRGKTPEHDASWKAEDKEFCAALKRELELDYEAVAAYCESKGRPRPSAMTSEQRHTLFDYLVSDPGRASFATWRKAAS